jgi:P27 family predicted phage terminase small subunit
MKNSLKTAVTENDRGRSFWSGSAPAHLRPDTQAWWQSVHRDYDLGEHHTRLLTLACEAWDRCQQAREILDQDGIILGGREGGARPHPAVAIERDARLSFCRIVAQLSLDVEMLPDPIARAAQRSNRLGGWKASNGQTA